MGTRRTEAEDYLLNGSPTPFHDWSAFALGEEDARELERLQAEGRREREYAERVHRMERVVRLRRRELAAKDDFDSLR